jgi:tetratricopeptide (TPR) repeat protein
VLRRVRGSWFIIVALTLCAQTRVHAQAAAGAQLHAGSEYLEAGKAAYAAGRLDEALTAFERAYELLKTPRTLFRIGDAADRLGLRARAVSAYQQYLDSVPTTSDRALVEARIQANRGPAPMKAVPVVQPIEQPLPSQSPVPREEDAAVQVQAMDAKQTQLAEQDAPLARRAAMSMPAEQEELAPSAAAKHAAPEAATAPVSDRKSHNPAWWIVAGVGVLAVSGIIAAALALGSSSARQPTPIQGNVGGTVQTLGAP